MLSELLRCIQWEYAYRAYCEKMYLLCTYRLNKQPTVMDRKTFVGYVLKHGTNVQVSV
jgi:hypothetical protein